jgi:hypothetical protein
MLNWQASRREAKIVGGPTDFGKPAMAAICPPCGTVHDSEAIYAVVGALASWCQISSRRRISAIALIRH